MNQGLDNHLRELMAAAQKGDGAAYAVFLKEISPLLRGMVGRRRSFLDAADREDLVQDILLSVHKVRGTYDPDRPLIPWLAAIAANRLADSGRQHARQAKVAEIAQDFHETFPALATNTEADTYGDVDALRAAVAELPEGQRRAVELVKLQEMSIKEASAETGMTVAAIKVSIHRAVKSLQASMKKDV